MAVTTARMTADELFCLPDDGVRYELVYGALGTMPLHGAQRGWVTSDLHLSLSGYVRAHCLGKVFAAGTGFVLAYNPDTVLAADVAFVCRERALAVGRRPQFWTGPPDLAIEVLSPSDRPGEVADKIAAWLRYGTRIVIAVDPRRRTAPVHRPGQPPRILTEADALDGEDVVPDWTLSLAELFAEELAD
jgi:Uma2 family endonuclease